MFFVQQKINEATPTKMHHKRSHSEIDKSPKNDHLTYKKYAAAFSYDKTSNIYEAPAMSVNEYSHDRTDNIYKVNVRNVGKSPINRIGFMKMLSRQNVKNITTSKKVSWNTLCLHFSSRDDANNFTKQDFLGKSGYEAYIPAYYRSVVGVIKGVPVDLTANEIFDAISNNENILKIERMTRKLKNGHRDYSLNIKVTFNLTILPKRVSIYHGLEKVEPYIQSVLQCMGCLSYGHQIYACKAQNRAKCLRCGSEDHEKSECTASRPSCAHCKGEHEANFKECVERKRQENIKILMSGKNLSYREVLEQFPTYTSHNQFNLLENLEDFPALHRKSYKDQLVGKRNKIVFGQNRTRRIFTPKQPEKFSNYYSLQSHSTGPSIPLPPNNNKVSEEEKLTTLASQKSARQVRFANEDSLCDSFNDSTSSTDADNTNLSSRQEENKCDNKTNSNLPST